MSWIDKLNNTRFKIKTGDGKEFFPLWKDAEKSKEYNTSTYDFIDVEKSLVERKKPKSNKYPLVFYFQGENCLEQAKEFEQSADDNRYWTVTHPFYGTIKGQPLSIAFDDKNYNVSIVTVDFWETIIFEFPKSNLSVQDNVLVKKQAIFEECVDNYANQDVQEVSDIQKLKQSIAKISNSYNKLKNEITNNQFINNVSKAYKSVNNLIANPNIFILDAISVINIPNKIAFDIKTKLDAYKTAFNTLGSLFESKGDKVYFESAGASLIASYCDSAVNFDFDIDFKVGKDIVTAIDDLLNIYNSYTSILDNSTGSVYDDPKVNFSINPVIDQQLYNLVMFTASNLSDLVLDAQQERSYYLPTDSNMFVLTHKFYGSATDANIERFKATNGIKLIENFKLKKGRKIIYYV